MLILNAYICPGLTLIAGWTEVSTSNGLGVRVTFSGSSQMTLPEPQTDPRRIS
jgi:hypothetical protein